MSYSSMGQNGIFGGFGAAIPKNALYAAPPYIDDGGLRRIDPSSLTAFKWSINSTTNTNFDAGSTMQEVPGFKETYLWEIGAGVGDSWLDTYVNAGFVVLFWGKSVDQLGPTLSFAVSKDPMYIAANAATAADYATIIDGPQALIDQARAIVSGTAPSTPTGGACPPGTVGIPPACFPSTVPSTTPTPSTGGCPSGTVGIPPFCVPTTVPGGQTTPPITPPITPPVTPPATTCPPGTTGVPPACTPVTTKPPATLPTESKTETPSWVFPALIGVAGVSLFVILAASQKKR